MDSFKYLKQKLKAFSLDRLRRSKAGGRALCCLGFDGDQFSLVYVRLQKNHPEIQLIDSVACDPLNPQPVLTEFVKQNQLEGIDCSWMLQGDKYQLLTLDELPVKAEEFQSAIRWQIKKLLSFPVENAFIDSFPVPPAQITNPKKLITVVAAQTKYIQPLAQQIIDSGLNLTTIDIPELGLRNITALYETDDQSTALVYLREKSSDLIITRQKSFYFSRRLDWNFEHLTDSIGEQDSVNRYLDKLALEIQRSFDYYQSQWRLPLPGRVLIVSLSPDILDIAAYLTQRLRLSVENLNLNKVLLSKPKLTSSIEFQYLPYIGGALREEMSYATAD